MIELKDAVDRVLALPGVASKMFLISIGDRTVGGLTARDQCVGPWQVPVADAQSRWRVTTRRKAKCFPSAKKHRWP